MPTVVSFDKTTEVTPARSKQDQTAYGGLLERRGMSFKEYGPYLVVGEIPEGSYWQIHISATKRHLNALFEIAIPRLENYGVSFRMVKDQTNGEMIANGGLGYEFWGQVLTIYPVDDAGAVSICHDLGSVTLLMKGPAVPGAYHLIGTLYLSHTRTQKPTLNKKDKEVDGKALLKFLKKSAFSLPSGVKWPFDSIAPFTPIKYDNLLNGKYLVQTILKSDVKGNVLRGVFLNKWRLLSCVIKEGKIGINEDDHGRDAAYRISWQWELHNKLKGLIGMPEHFDYFEKNGKAYIVTKFIASETLERAVANILGDSNWHELSGIKKRELFHYLMQLIDTIKNLHQAGLVHRDITPFNFVIDRNRQLIALDLELAWDLISSSQRSPLLKGTIGYMSPEQEMGSIPTTHEDVYAVGALIIYIFTGLYPNHFSITDPHLKRNLEFFFKDADLARLVALCLSIQPSFRPTLFEIQDEIKRISNPRTCQQNNKQELRNDELSKILIDGLSGLHLPTMFNQSGIWKCQDDSEVKIFSGERRLETVAPGLFDGVSGVLYVISKAINIGIKWNCNYKDIISNTSYVIDNIKYNSSTESWNFSTGVSGINLMLWEGKTADIFGGSKVSINRIIREPYFSGLNESKINLTLGKGIAGILLSQLSLQASGGPQISQMDILFKIICNNQRKDGSWEGVRETGLLNGMAGIIGSLLEGYTLNRDEGIRKTAIKGLSMLLKLVKYEGGKPFWYKTIGSKDINPWLTGDIGISWVFLKAWRVLGDKQYRQIGESVLYSYPDKITSNYFSTSYGISGLGQVYLSAWQITGDVLWRQRAAWIAQVLGHTFYRPCPNAGYWFTDRTFNPLPGLLNGSCGPIYFLLRYLNPEKHFLLNH